MRSGGTATHGRHTIGNRGVAGSRWIPRSSKPVTLRSARRGGFDSHALPPALQEDTLGGPRTVADPSQRPPSVDRVVDAVGAAPPARHDHQSLVETTRQVLDDERQRLVAGQPARTVDALAASVLDRLGAWAASPVVRILNATGVIVHTNLGRAPWPDEAIQAAAAASASLLLE